MGGDFTDTGDGNLWCQLANGTQVVCDTNGKDCWYVYRPPVQDDPLGDVTAPVDGGMAPAAGNAAPDAAVDAYRVAEDRVLRRGAAGGVLANDADPDGDALTARLVAGPSKGTLTLEDDGSFVYKPKRNFRGTVSFTYEVEDGTGGTATATIKVLARPS